MAGVSSGDAVGRVCLQGCRRSPAQLPEQKLSSSEPVDSLQTEEFLERRWAFEDALLHMNQGTSSTCIGLWSYCVA